MTSMTGYGSGQATAGGLTVGVELRSVNHRFFEAALKLPAALAPFEAEIRAYLKDNLARGRISCAAQVQDDTGAAGVVLDPARVEHGLAVLEALAARLAERTGRRPEIGLRDLLAVPDLLAPAAEAAGDQTALGEALREALAIAVAQLRQMREQEGRELAAELARRAAAVRGHLAEVSRLAPTVAQETLEKLRARLAQLAAAVEIDPQRLAQEAAILADRANIAEECERLASHLEQFAQALAQPGEVAKRLNFLLQEMHREVNTMGAKTSLLAITQAVIAMKEEIESMREQVQNLE